MAAFVAAAGLACGQACGSPQTRVGTVCIGPAVGQAAGQACVRAEFAETRASREQGLMFRDSLARDEGMLFVHEREAVISLWMKNTRIPLDMIWISADKRVVYIVEHAEPCVCRTPDCDNACESIVPPVKAQYVLEVNAGFVKERGISLGDGAVF